jgi:hypothetical protein
MDHIPLERAYFCLDCETVQASSNHCNFCCSGAVWPLARFLNRERNGRGGYVYLESAPLGSELGVTA